jgi:hypothetical protein
MFKIKLILMLLALGVAGGGFLYVKNLQANLAISEANNAKLETGIEEQKKLMAQREQDFEAQKKMYAELQNENARLERERKFLETRFNKTNADGKVRDLGDLAANRPMSVERILNNDMNNQIRCNEIAQGSPLTEEEKAVKLKTDPGYNAICSPSANPNYEGN